VPGGVGLAERLFGLLGEMVEASRRLVADCPCAEGCPSCVGPAAEVGPRGKAATAELLAALG